MAAPASTPKIEELRFRLKTDPKSRLFYPLAEELRKFGLCADAEQVLRTGLLHHPAYLSAWVSLGRVAREQGKNDDAIEALSKALQIDPGNVVAARLLADSYLASGEKIEAIKKYKLVHALMPSDSEVEAVIERLEHELNPIVMAPEPEPEPEAEPEPEPPPFVEEPPASAEEAILSADAEPMRVAHEESPFEEPVEDFTAAAVEVEAPLGIHVEEAPLAAETPSPWDSPEPTETVTMADLYARQGLTGDARRIYESILQRDPSNDAVRSKLAELDPPVRKKISRLESWLSKVSRREVSGV
ncbi:MAG TPA: tetratricopeptide repeat protein [Thermoanaerobaculia bacterium]|jgi:tetratricopeptide (TPR) repeat protein